MSYKIFHTADIHLGVTPGGSREKGLDINKAMVELGVRVEESWPDMVILAGDIFDHPSVQPDDYGGLISLLTACQRVKAKVVWIEGNHDSSKIDKANRSSRTWPEVMSERFDCIVRCEICPDTGLPRVYPLRPRKNTGKVDQDDDRPLMVCPIDWRPRDQIRELLDNVPVGYCDIVVLHQSLEGVIAKIGNPEIEPDHIRDLAKLVCMGDIHMKSVTELGPNQVALYPGPPEWIKVDQIGQNGFLEIDFDVKNDSYEYKFRKLPTRDYFYKEIISGETIDIAGSLAEVGIIDPDGETKTEMVGDSGFSAHLILPLELTPGPNWGGLGIYFNLAYKSSPDGNLRELAKTVCKKIEAAFPGQIFRMSLLGSTSADQASDEREDENGGVSIGLTMEEAIIECSDDLEQEDDEERIVDRIKGAALSLWGSQDMVETILTESLNKLDEN